MSHLYGSLDGDRGKTVTKASNRELSGHVRGWNAGVRVTASHGDGGDEFHIALTSGSGGTRCDRPIGVVRNGGFIPHDVVTFLASLPEKGKT